MRPRAYASPAAFKQALEQRLRASAKSGSGFARKRQRLVFDRFLARVVAVLGDAATLKGGLVLELRLERARTTKDVDLRVVGLPEEVLPKLQEAGRRDLGDFMTFEVGPDDDHPVLRNDGNPYDGFRFRAECKLAGQIYGQPFGVDVGIGDPIFGEPERVVAADVLAFAGIAPPMLRLYPIETHIAEKLHAYTMPRARLNSRVKDLPDLALLATARALDAKRLRAALKQTFSYRKTHALPSTVPEPLEAWRTPYAAMAREDELVWPTLDEVTKALLSWSHASEAALSPEARSLIDLFAVISQATEDVALGVARIDNRSRLFDADIARFKGYLAWMRATNAGGVSLAGQADQDPDAATRTAKLGRSAIRLEALVLAVRVLALQVDFEIVAAAAENAGQVSTQWSDQLHEVDRKTGPVLDAAESWDRGRMEVMARAHRVEMQKLREDIDARRPLAQNAPSADHRIAGAFVTSHRHTSGSHVEILHLRCSVARP